MPVSLDELEMLPLVYSAPVPRTAGALENELWGLKHSLRAYWEVNNRLEARNKELEAELREHKGSGHE